jgi:VIT1/CCC1 family predicted Fe2+/Mn2+ transporter
LAEIAAASSPVSIMKDTIESLIILVILLAITILIGGLLAMFRRG